VKIPRARVPPRPFPAREKGNPPSAPGVTLARQRSAVLCSPTPTFHDGWNNPQAPAWQPSEMGGRRGLMGPRSGVPEMVVATNRRTEFSLRAPRIPNAPARSRG
jgi:hypothetical protein